MIPADEDAEAAKRCSNRFKARVARREVELLVIGRVVGNVHFAVDAGKGAVFFDDNGGIVIKSGRTFLKEGQNEDNAQFTCQCAVGFRGRSGYGFRQIKHRRVFRLAEVERIVEFGEDDEFGSPAGTGTDGGIQPGDIGGSIAGV
ncbi:hypothetical protein Barb6_03365 [Bacteroidales bacterium Barb6]|nr:hypothetical protein Barb6_03365 [Bacteroidales bacterium Barb6]